MSDETTDLTELKDAVRAGLRKCRHEEAPIPIIRDADLFHITHMVATEVAAAGFGPVRSEHSPGETCAEADERAADNWARAESAEAALAGTWEQAHDVFCPRRDVCSTHLRPGDRHLLAPTHDREEER